MSKNFFKDKIKQYLNIEYQIKAPIIKLLKQQMFDQYSDIDFVKNFKNKLKIYNISEQTINQIDLLIEKKTYEKNVKNETILFADLSGKLKYILFKENLEKLGIEEYLIQKIFNNFEVSNYNIFYHKYNIDVENFNEEEQLLILNHKTEILNYGQYSNLLVLNIRTETEDHIKAHLAKLCQKNSGIHDKDYRNDLFHPLIDKVAVPIITNFFKDIIKQAININQEDFKLIFKMFGKLRKKIAEEVQDGTDNVGKLVEESKCIFDPVSGKLSWNKWQENIKMVIKESYQQSNSQLSFMGNGEQAGIKAKGSGATIGFSYKIIDDKIEPYSIVFQHKTLELADYEKMFKHVQLILDFNQQADLNGLQKLLASLFWEMNQCSIYERGQAAISEMLIKALANVKSCGIQWDLKNTGMNLDQWALTLIEKEKFIKFFIDNVNCKSTDENFISDNLDNGCQTLTEDDIGIADNNDDPVVTTVTGDLDAQSSID